MRSDEDRALIRRLTPSMDRLIGVSKAIVAKLAADFIVLPFAQPRAANIESQPRDVVALHRLRRLTYALIVHAAAD